MKNVAVVFGSRSAEHDISVITAINAIIEPLKLTNKYKPIPVYIAKDGSWYSSDELGSIDFFAGGDVETKLKKLKKINLKFDDGLWLVKPGIGGEKTKIDVVFPATHGTYGEDGSLMGLLRMADVAFVGCDLQSSVVAMDKGLTKTVLNEVGLPSVKYVLFSDLDYKKDKKAVEAKLDKLKFPLFVKPVHLGSSIAITMVKDKKQLDNAIELAFHYDDGVIVEEGVTDLTEVTVPVMGNEEPRVALVEESLNKHAGFFDFQAKYMDQGKTKKINDSSDKGSYSRLPAKLPKKLYEECEQVALDAFIGIGASGTARVDLLIDNKTKKVYVNEINPLPGSLYAHNWKRAGVSNVELVSELIKFAEERYEKYQKLDTVFESNYLKQF